MIVNCVECYSQRFLFEHVLNAIRADVAAILDASALVKCDNMSDFVRLLQQEVVAKKVDTQTVYIVSGFF